MGSKNKADSLKDKVPGGLKSGFELLSRARSIAWLWGLLPVSAAGGASYWAYLTQWGYLPIALTALGVFVAVIWAINGIVWFSQRDRPSRARVTFDYAYALSLEEIEIGYDEKNLDNTLEFRPIIRNHANGPIRYIVTSFNIHLGDRYFSMHGAADGVLVRTGKTTIFPAGGFSKDAFDSFGFGSKGSLEYSISYGHPEDDLSRVWNRKCELHYFRKDRINDSSPDLSIRWIVRAESDEALY